MKLAVIGSRTFNDYNRLKSILDKIHNFKYIELIISGGANGADLLGEKWAKENHIKTLVFKPDWDKFGKSAGYKRNIEIVNSSDTVIAFWDGVSKGTQHSINIAKEQNKKCYIINF